MSADAQPAPATVGRACHVCSKPLADGGKFCPFCGSQTLDVSTISSIEAYIQTKVDQEIAKRFTDQNSLIREIGDKAEDIVWRRLKYFGYFLTFIAVLLGFLGVKSVNDVSQSIVRETAGRVDAVKGRLDQLHKTWTFRPNA
jgi:RNA polymerase subunit RPABC4/transcription elongation factor Spt4